jgi:U1 small nuclear ribonucleoprotein C
MPKYYCDYCDVFLTHDSQAGRKQHNHGRRHQENVRQFFAQFLASNMQAPGAYPMTFMPIPEEMLPKAPAPVGPGAPLMIRPAGGPGGLGGPGAPGGPGMPGGRPPMMGGMPGMGMMGRPPFGEASLFFSLPSLSSFSRLSFPLCFPFHPFPSLLRGWV